MYTNQQLHSNLKGKMENFLEKKSIMAMAMMMVALLAVRGSAQKTGTCGAQLVPCRDFLNSTNPPESCCGPLRNALTNDLSCLCAIYNDPTLLKAYGIDLNQALQLPKNCGKPSFSSQVACVNSTAGAPSTAPPATPGANSNHAAHRATWFGMSGLMSLFLFWWSVMA